MKPTVDPCSRAVAILIGMALCLAACATSDPSAIGGGSPTTLPTSPPGARSLWRPPLATSWQWQLDGSDIDLSVNAAVFDVDGFSTPATTVATLHSFGRHAICYISAGSWEAYRPDAGQFLASVLGKTLSGYPDERWLDIRQIAALRPIMTARIAMCAKKGFDAVEPDNVDGFENATGFPLNAQDQLTYNRMIAAIAHAYGLSVGLKNDPDQIPDLLSDFDWTLDEQCFQYQFCDQLLPFIQSGKPVFEVEYSLPIGDFCPQAVKMHFNSMRKHLSLDAYRVPCG
jgi:hypothetical protein